MKVPKNWVSYSGGLYSFKVEPRVSGTPSGVERLQNRLMKRFKRQLSGKSGGLAGKKATAGRP
jgi:hypothetical protein